MTLHPSHILISCKKAKKKVELYIAPELQKKLVEFIEMDGESIDITLGDLRPFHEGGAMHTPLLRFLHWLENNLSGEGCCAREVIPQEIMVDGEPETLTISNPSILNESTIERMARYIERRRLGIEIENEIAREIERDET